MAHLQPRKPGRARNLSVAAAGGELHRLCRSGDLSAVRSYLNETLTETVVNRAAGLNGCTPLHEAAMAGCADVVRLLTDECESLDINVRTQRGPAFTPLHLAAERGRIETVIALIDCGASLSAVDRRCRTGKDIAAENGHRQVVAAITAAEVEKATNDGNVLKMTDALSQLSKHTRLSSEVAEWKQEKLNCALQIACKLGNYRLAVPLIKAGAENFEECIQNAVRMNHILAFLRLCQAARENDEEAIDLLLTWNEEVASANPRYSAMNQYNSILMPLIENGTLTVAVPIRVALKYNNVHAVGRLLANITKNPDPTSIDWHGLELESINPGWLAHCDYSALTLVSFSFNALRQVPPEILKLRSLSKLQLASNELTFIPTELFSLEKIEHIDLSQNKISSLPEGLIAPVSPNLQVLDLSRNEMASFPNYFSKAKLTKLDLSWNKFQDVPKPIFNLRLLESLDMSHNVEIKHVPYELGGLRNLKLFAVENIHNTVNIPHKERGSMLQFLQDRYKSMQTVTHYEIQVIAFPQYTKCVDGVMNILVTSDLKCSVLKYNTPTEFLFLFEIFKLPNALYVVPWDCHSEQEANKLHVVLRHLSVHAPDSPVIIAACWRSQVLAQYELHVDDQISMSLWHDLIDKVRVQHLVLEAGEIGAESAQLFITTVHNCSERIRNTRFIPCSYYSCDKLLKAESERMQREKRSLFVSEWDFWELVRSMPSHDLSGHFELPELVEFLCSKASVAHLPSPKESEAYYVLSRQWYCHVLGNIISQNSLLMARSKSGVVRQEGLIDLLGSSYLQLPIPVAVQYVLNRYGIALALSSERWLLPSMLNKEPDLIFKNFSLDDIRRQYTCTLVPITLMGRLINHLLINMEMLVKQITRASSGQLSKQPEVDWAYWRNGIVCWMNAFYLVYSIEKINVNTDPFHEGIEIRVPNTKFGHKTMHLLTLTIDSLLKNWYPSVWKTVEVWVPCSYCIYTEKPDVPSISFQDCLYALSKGVGVKCVQHVEKVVKIAKIVPDLVQEEIEADAFLPPYKVSLNPADKLTCLSPAPMETVFKGTYKKSLVAVKPYPPIVPNTAGKDPGQLESTPVMELWTEFEILIHLQSAKCPYIVSVMGMCPDPLCLVFPFAKWSSLEEVISVKEILIPRFVRLKMVLQLATALEVLHSNHIIHRNVCLSNILVYSLSADEPVNIKLAGFSDACYGIFQGVGVGCFGTFPAPEMTPKAGSEYCERVDIFAFGFVAYEIITRSTVHVRSSTPLQKSSSCLTSIDRPSLAPVHSRAPYLCDLIEKCWNPDSFKRPYASKIVEICRQPLHTLVHDGNLISEKHEFYAAAAKFTRVKNSFHTDVYICSGELTGQSTAYLTHLSLPDTRVNKTVELPSEFVVCMGCVGPQLWISFFGKKVRVYSTTGKMNFINEFSFSHHVVAIGVSPTAVYLGLENGVLQVYDINEANIPTEPRYNKMVCPNEAFKAIEPLETSVMCATNDSVYRLHPDTLVREAHFNIKGKADIRSIVISELSYEDEDQCDTIWVSFRRTDKVQVLNSWTGELLYTISCASIVELQPNKVWVYSLRVVLDTVWIGLNTGHVLIFAASATEPHLISHVHIHCSDIRQLLLLHPSYMGNMTILSASEMLNLSMQKTQSDPEPLSSIKRPDSVLVLSMGTGIKDPLPNVQLSEENKECVNTNGLYAVVLEGMSESRLTSLEEISSREPTAYMRGFGLDEDEYYCVPPLEDSWEHVRKSRTDTWSAPEQDTPIQAQFPSLPDPKNVSLKTISEGGEDYVSMAAFYEHGKENGAAPPLPPRPTDLHSSLEDSAKYDYPYISPDILVHKSHSLRPVAAFPDQDAGTPDIRRSTINTAAIPQMEEYDPYVTMGAVQAQLKKSSAPKPTISPRTHIPLSGTKSSPGFLSLQSIESVDSPTDDFVTRDVFLGTNQANPPSLPPKIPVRTPSEDGASIDNPESPVSNKPALLPKPAHVPKPHPRHPPLARIQSTPPRKPKVYPRLMKTPSVPAIEINDRRPTMYSDIEVDKPTEDGVRTSLVEEVTYVTVKRTAPLTKPSD